MRKSLLPFMAVACLAASPAAAEQGKYGSALTKMLSATAAGTCPAELMGDKLLAACKDQLSKLQPELASFGAIKSAKFVKAVGKGDRRVETYAVTFAKGNTAQWHIGVFQNGKYQTAYSKG